MNYDTECTFCMSLIEENDALENKINDYKTELEEAEKEDLIVAKAIEDYMTNIEDQKFEIKELEKKVEDLEWELENSQISEKRLSTILTDRMEDI